LEAPHLLSQDAVERLYREHGHLVLRRASELLGHEEDAREILQEVFLSLVHHREQYLGRSAITTWLYAATTHACLNRLRNQRTRRRLLNERSYLPTRNDGDPHAERCALVRELLTKLPAELSVVAAHYYLDEMTQQEIAAQIGCSRTRVGEMLRAIENHFHSSKGAQ
jgi:RNA polymerase sigma-70 factor (ECF subfamily)